MDTNDYRKYEPFFNAWYIKELIGEGSFGKVYEIERKEMGVTYRAAMKTITIPQSRSELKSIMSEGMSNKDVTAYYHGIVQDIINEFVLMSKLKGTSNIVSYEDHMVIEHEDGIGWDILIRMELLTPLYDHMVDNNMSKKDVIKMGIDLCKALELCQKYNIIHRDVKPENIFISNNGDYKLGDFGIARTVEKTSSGLSRKGTYGYMAPEVYRGDAYGATVDIYSLGIVMYRLLNDNRTPFLPAYPAPITYSDKEDALMKRISGSPLPPPTNADGELAEIILKACSYEAKDRFSSAADMRLALESVLHGQSEEGLPYIGDAVDLIKSVDYADANNETSVTEEKTESIFENIQHYEDVTDILEKTESDLKNSESKLGTAPASSIHPEKMTQVKKKKTGLIAGAAAAIVVLAAILFFALGSKDVEDIVGLEAETSIYIGESISPDYKILPEKYSDEEISFTIEDEEIISIDENGTITGIKEGSTTLTMKVKGYEESVEIIVTARITGISNVDDEIELDVGDVLQLEPKLSPEEASGVKITYLMVDDAIASVNEQGKIMGLKAGRTELIIHAGGYEKVVTVIVTGSNYYVPQSAPAPGSSDQSDSDEAETPQESTDSTAETPLDPSDDTIEAPTDVPIETPEITPTEAPAVTDLTNADI